MYVFSLAELFLPPSNKQANKHGWPPVTTVLNHSIETWDTKSWAYPLHSNNPWAYVDDTQGSNNGNKKRIFIKIREGSINTIIIMKLYSKPKFILPLDIWVPLHPFLKLFSSRIQTPTYSWVTLAKPLK